MQSTLYLPGVNYYNQINFVSNSELGAYDDWMNGRTKPANLQQAYDFGNLLDAIMTEPTLVNEKAMTVQLAFGDVVGFTPEIFNKAQKMKRDALSDETMQTVFANMNFQYEQYVDEFEIKTDFAEIRLPVRIKMDGNAQRISTGMDLKSTQCKTRQQFIDSLYHFNYDRQGALYMDVSGSKRFWFLGVGKIADKQGRHPVYKFCFQKGDDFYLSGKKKYERLATQYHKYIYSLNPELIHVR